MFATYYSAKANKLKCTLTCRGNFECWGLEQKRKMTNFDVFNKPVARHVNSLFPSCLSPLFQGKAWCKAFHKKTRFTPAFKRTKCARIKPLFKWNALHCDSLWNRGEMQLGNGPFDRIWKPAASFDWLGAHAPVSERSNPSRTRFETEAKGNSEMDHLTGYRSQRLPSAGSCKREK